MYDEQDPDHQAGMALHAMSSACDEILILALNPIMRDKLDAKDISRAIERLQDALVLKTRELAA